MAELHTTAVLTGFAFSGGYLTSDKFTMTMVDATGESFDMSFFMSEEMAQFLDVLTAKVNRNKRIPTINARMAITLEVVDG